jgi:hypothetical protein
VGVNVWRYQTRERVEIGATVERVYTLASDPASVPTYAPEVARIEVLRRLSAHAVLVRSHLKVTGLTFAQLYRYHYRPPTHYSGVQEHGRLVRGYFNLTFGAKGDRTLVSHTEGITSTIPCLAWVAGFIYFRLLARGRMGQELDRLKRLIEQRAV